jgi:D-glycero-alpha-D-manno-heptose 1-phosphate guanylyltransferase
MKAVVLAGGLGTRLQERVPDLPKPMAPVAGRPFLEYVIDRLVNGGVREIILSVGYLADVIVAHFGHCYRNAALRYAVEDEPLGTGGAIAHALRGESDDSVLVLNGDTLLKIDYCELLRWYKASPAQVAMVLRNVPDTARYGAVMLDGEWISGFTEKGRNGPGLINAGIYIVQSNIFKTYGLKGKFGFEADLLQRHYQSLRPRAFVTDAYFIDIGIPEDYDRAQRELPILLNDETPCDIP